MPNRKESCMLLAMIVASASLAASVEAAPFIYEFTSIPADGHVDGPPGSTVGWGYSITNEDPTHWLLTLDLTSAPFTSAVPDASFFDFPVIAPMSSVIVPFNLASHLGLFAAVIDAAAPVGLVNAGVFTLTAEWWDGDPAAGGSFLQTAPNATADYSSLVTGAPEIPEPSSLILLASGLAAAYRTRGSLRRCIHRQWSITQ